MSWGSDDLASAHYCHAPYADTCGTCPQKAEKPFLDLDAVRSPSRELNRVKHEGPRREELLEAGADSHEFQSIPHSSEPRMCRRFD